MKSRRGAAEPEPQPERKTTLETLLKNVKMGAATTTPTVPVLFRVKEPSKVQSKLSTDMERLLQISFPAKCPK